MFYNLVVSVKKLTYITHFNKEDEESISANILGFDGAKLRSIREQQLRTAEDIPLRPQNVSLSYSIRFCLFNDDKIVIILLCL